MPKSSQQSLSRRERQIMDVIYRQPGATVAEVREQMPSPPGYSAVRALLRILEEKGHLRHTVDGPRYLFHPVVPRDTERRNALKHLIQTFFEGSTSAAMAALLESADTRLSREELEQLAERIGQARKEGR